MAGVLELLVWRQQLERKGTSLVPNLGETWSSTPKHDQKLAIWAVNLKLWRSNCRFFIGKSNSKHTADTPRGSRGVNRTEKARIGNCRDGWSSRAAEFCRILGILGVPPFSRERARVWFLILVRSGHRRRTTTENCRFEQSILSFGDLIVV